MTEFEALVAKVNANSFLPDDWAIKRSGRRVSKRVFKLLMRLDASKAELLIELLEGRWATLTVSEVLYAVKQDGRSWRIRNVESGAEYEVPLDLSACTCPDFKFRDHGCKHMAALRRLSS